jgi:alpha-tubulin suppressor-like RCC1 family protein
MKTLKTIALLLLISLSQNATSQCWTQIAAGEYHTVAIKSDGTLWAWGNNDYGQLGDGTTTNKSVPTQIGTDTDWATIDAFYYNTFAIKTNGSLWGWGSNSNGQLGDGNHGSGVYNFLPTQVGSDTDWVKINAGGTYAIKNNGTLWGWGYNFNGRLGTGDNLPHYTPFQIGTDTNWTDVKAGGNNTLALKSNHTLWGWGMNKRGSLAIGEPSETFIITTPTQTGNNTSDWQKIEVGVCCDSKMLKTDGSLWAMGLGSNGNLGNGDILDVNTPTQVANDIDWNTITTSNHSCAIKNNGTLWSWGANFQGQVGDGTFINRTAPIQIGIDKTWLMVKTGANHTVAISGDNTLYTWGFNNKGQLGDGTLIDKAVITQIGNSCPLSTSSFETIQSIQAIPNPTTNATVIRFLANENTAITITITNILGQIISQKNKKSNLGENQESIDLSTLSAGVYCITLNTDKQQSTLKIIKN